MRARLALAFLSLPAALGPRCLSQARLLGRCTAPRTTRPPQACLAEPAPRPAPPAAATDLPRPALRTHTRTSQHPRRESRAHLHRRAPKEQSTEQNAHTRRSQSIERMHRTHHWEQKTQEHAKQQHFIQHSIHQTGGQACARTRMQPAGPRTVATGAHAPSREPACRHRPMPATPAANVRLPPTRWRPL
ncbi:hypothetical protein NEAUS03_1787 [Nematocida ausubeli]|nr:hypothetical protein NEAUS03_1787 [Nematocida ausubeli]KAI5186963.1 hypothetical protein NEIRO03_2429 [Nematocida sp. AWRm78]